MREGMKVVLVDAHVHYYGCFGWPAFLDAAARNLTLAAGTVGADPRSPRYLLFSETSGEHHFERVKQGRISPPAGWKRLETEEDCSVVLIDRDDAPTVLVGGRQVVSREGLEVLVLGVSRSAPDGRPAREIIGDAMAEGAITVLPWGFGKWWFGRGRLVRDLLARTWPLPLFLGDTANRPEPGPTPAFGRFGDPVPPILPGSDPLPLPGHAERAGRLGFVTEIEFSPVRPAATLRREVLSFQRSPGSFGRLPGPLSVGLDQLRMQLRRLPVPVFSGC